MKVTINGADYEVQGDTIVCGSLPIIAGVPGTPKMTLKGPNGNTKLDPTTELPLTAGMVFEVK